MDLAFMTCDAWTPHRVHQHVRRYRKGGIKEPEKHAGRLAIAPSRRRSTQSVFGCATFSEVLKLYRGGGSLSRRLLDRLVVGFWIAFGECYI